MLRVGLDSRQSWIVAVACFFVQVLTFGLADASGLLFVATIEKFNSSREETSLPFTLAYCVRSATGPLVSYLGLRYGMRQVTLFGAVLSSISVGACFFADDIVDLTLLWGLVFGFSFGMETSLLNVILNEHFLKNRVKANGLNISGASLGVLLLSPLIENSVEAYGLSGTFLIIAGLMLNSIPACMIMILNKLNENGKPTVHISAVSEENFDVKSCNESSPDILLEKPVIYSLAELNKCDKSIKIDYMGESYRKRKTSDGPETNAGPSIILNVPELKNAYNDDNHFHHDRVMKESPTPPACHTKSYQEHTKDVSKNGFYFHSSPAGEILKTEPILNDDLPKQLSCVNNENKKNPHDPLVHASAASSSSSSSSNWKIYLLFREPIYIVLVICSAIYYFSIVTFLTIIVDHAIDIGISLTYSTYILMWLAVSDMFGYFILSWIIERCNFSQIKFAAFSYLCVCLMCIGVVWSTHYIMFLVLITVFEFGQCGIYVLCAPVVAKLIDKDLQATALASVTILSSPITMAIAPIIGYFRDGKRSYDGVFYVISAATFLCCILFLFLPKLERRRNRRRSKT